MALMECKECGKQLSDMAEKCPNCGFPVQSCKKGTKEESTSQSRKVDFKLALTIFMCICIPYIGIIFLWVFKIPKSKLKRVLLTILLMCYALISVSDADTETERESNIQETQIVEEKSEPEVTNEEPQTFFEYADMTVEFIGYEIEENYVGDKCLVLYFDFTNNRDESQAFGYTFSVKTFQNGVELEPTYFQVNDETENSSKEIKQGITLRVAEQYGIEDVSGNISVEIEPFNIWSDKVLFEYEFSLD